MSRRSAFTLAELLVAGFLGALLLGVILMLWVNFSREAERPQASASMEETSMTLVRWLQHDLSETNLQSVLTLPNESGVAMESPRDIAQDLIQFSAYGTVAWQKFLYYQVKPNPNVSIPLPPKILKGATTVNNPSLGNLSYDESPISPLPSEPGQPPAGIPSFQVNKHRDLAHNVLTDPASNQMGMAVYFMDASNNPQPFTASQRGEPVCVALYLMDVSSRTGKPTTRKLTLAVKPRN